MKRTNDPAALTWAADAYLAFGDHRLRPALELLSRIDTSPRSIVDLGCGAGGPTRWLARRWPDATLVGIDHSDSMLETARASDRAESDSRARAIDWRQGDVAAWRPDDDDAPDLIFSNACLHWIGDHDALFPRLLSDLAPGGVLAVQMPLSWPQPSHRLMREVLDDLGLTARVPTLYQRPVDEPDVYMRRFRGLTAQLDVWTTTYQQVMTGEEPVYRFVLSTGLRTVQDALDGDEWSRFEPEYRGRLLTAYPREADGTTIFPFRRLFLVATKP